MFTFSLGGLTTIFVLYDNVHNGKIKQIKSSSTSEVGYG
jgi:uncharacterized membrane protein